MLDFSLLPTWYMYCLVGGLGAIIGSFINVVAYRMHTGVSINGRSRCFSCAHTLTWYELIPFASYLLQRGRCRKCRANIPRRDFWVELVMASLFIMVVSWAQTWFAAAIVLVLTVVLVLVVIYDLVHLIIPNELVVLIAVLGVIAYGWQTWSTVTLTDGLWLLGSVSMAASVYLLLWYISQGRWIGFGDVKLAAALGVWLTPAAAFSMIIFSFWVGALVGLLLLTPALIRRTYQRYYPRARHTRTATSYTMKSEIPFAPFIVVAFGMVYLYDISALSFITNLLNVFI